jgi:hypothetical protein
VRGRMSVRELRQSCGVVLCNTLPQIPLPCPCYSCLSSVILALTALFDVPLSRPFTPAFTVYRLPFTVFSFTLYRLPFTFLYPFYLNLFLPFIPCTVYPRLSIW